MLIAIPTLGRATRQRTWESIHPFWRSKTRFFVQAHEAEKYRQLYGEYVLVLPEYIRDVATTRDFIIDFAYGLPSTVLMLDDDLDFAARRQDDETKFIAAGPLTLCTAFEKLEAALHAHAHVSMSAREGANRNTEEWLWNTRAMRVLGYRPDIIKKHKLEFAPATFMCDFHMTLELLKLGYDNLVLNQFVNNQPGSNNVPGGCTGQRTPETQAAAAHWLAARHAPYVTVVKKTTKTSWGGEERTDVRIQWKAARYSERTFGATEILDGGEGQDPNPQGGGEPEALVE